MGSMPEVLSKGPILKKIDALSLKMDTATKFLDALQKSTGDLAQVFIDNGVLTNLEAIEHVRCDLKYWWPDAQPLEPIIRHGLIETFSVALVDPDSGAARTAPLVVDCYWCCEPGHDQPGAFSEAAQHGSVEVSVTWTKVQVTTILHTPEPPYPGPEGKTPEPIFIIKRDSTTGRIKKVRPNAEP